MIVATVMILMLCTPFAEARQHNPGAQRGYVHPGNMNSTIRTDPSPKQDGRTHRPGGEPKRDRIERIGGQGGRS